MTFFNVIIVMEDYKNRIKSVAWSFLYEMFYTVGFNFFYCFCFKFYFEKFYAACPGLPCKNDSGSQLEYS